jgi:putative transcriptional regulator
VARPWDDPRVSESVTGKLLVASPALVDPNFERTVVFICAHSDEGAFGVVINRPNTAARVADHLPRWAEHAVEPAVLFRGGPVEPTLAVALGRFNSGGEREGFVEVGDGIGLIDLERDPYAGLEGLQAIRLFNGYAGWSPGQLDGEIREGAWFVVEADAADPFSATPESLWRDVLRRQEGRLAMFAFFPAEPNRN